MVRAWALLAAGLVVLVAQVPAGSGEQSLLRNRARLRGGAPESTARLTFLFPPALTLRVPARAGLEGRRSPGLSIVAPATPRRCVAGAKPSPALAELRARAVLTRCAAAAQAGNDTAAAASEVPSPETRKAAKKVAAKKSAAVNKAAAGSRPVAASAEAARESTPKGAAAKKAVGARKPAAIKVPGEISPDQASAPVLEADEQRQDQGSAEGGVGRREDAEDDVEVQAPASKPKRRARKKALWTDDSLLVEFALKAVMLLREAGGELESSKFLLRWKCTFPSDEVSRYMSGRRLSVRQLLLQCGDTFTISEIPGSRTKKVFCINDEVNKALGGWSGWSVHRRGDEAAPADENATNARQGSGLVSGSLLWAEPQALEEDLRPPLTRGNRVAAMRGGQGRGAAEVVRVVKGGDKERSDASGDAPGMLFDFEGSWADEGFGEKGEQGEQSIAFASGPVEYSASPAASDDELSDRSFGEEEEEEGGEGEVQELPKFGSPKMSFNDDDLDDGGEWDFEKDGRIPKEQEGACSELCCELPVGDDECAKNVQSGIELIQSFKTMGITFGNVLSYNALLDMCARAANHKTSMYAKYALSILDMMSDNHVPPNADSYSAVIRTCSQSRDGLFQAITVLQDMRQAGMELASADYYLLFDACAKAAQQGSSLAVEQGLLVLETMCKGHIPADANRCLAMISVIPREGAWCNMCRDRMLELMQEAGLDYPSVKQAMEIVRERNTP